MAKEKAEAEAYQWRGGSPGVRYPGESHHNHTCTHMWRITPGVDNTAYRKGTPPPPGDTNTSTLGSQLLGRKGNKAIRETEKTTLHWVIIINSIHIAPFRVPKNYELTGVWRPRAHSNGRAVTIQHRREPGETTAAEESDKGARRWITSRLWWREDQQSSDGHIRLLSTSVWKLALLA